MIFTAIGLLVVALMMLIAGIIRSSAGLLALSVVATLAACIVLYASFRYYRAKAAAEAGTTGSSPLGWPAAYRGAAVGPAVSTLAPQVVAVSGNVLPPPIPNWDEVSDEDAVRLVEALNLDELHAARRHEVEHAHRNEVLRAIDARVDVIVGLRRDMGASHIS